MEYQGAKLYSAICRHCGRPIVQHPSGVWFPRQGSLKSDPKGIYCQTLEDQGGPEMWHEPMPAGLEGAPRWVISTAAQSPIGAPEEASKKSSTPGAGGAAKPRRRRVNAPKPDQGQPTRRPRSEANPACGGSGDRYRAGRRKGDR